MNYKLQNLILIVVKYTKFKLFLPRFDEDRLALTIFLVLRPQFWAKELLFKACV